MKRTFVHWFMTLLLAACGSAAAADDLYVACHAGLVLSPMDVRDMFVGEKQYLASVRLVPVDNLAVQGDFLARVLKMTDVRYANIWAKKSFRDGINPPAVLANDAAVLEFIRRTPGSCGYLAGPPADGATLVARY